MAKEISKMFHKLWKLGAAATWLFWGISKNIFTESHSEPCQIAKMELFVKIVNVWSMMESVVKIVNG